MSDLQTLKAQLAQAEAAYHKLMTEPGVSQIAFSLGGQNATSFSKIDSDKLLNYIGRLKIQIARLQGRGGGRIGQVIW